MDFNFLIHDLAGASVFMLKFNILLRLFVAVDDVKNLNFSWTASLKCENLTATVQTEKTVGLAL